MGKSHKHKKISKKAVLEKILRKLFKKVIKLDRKERRQRNGGNGPRSRCSKESQILQKRLDSMESPRSHSNVDAIASVLCSALQGGQNNSTATRKHAEKHSIAGASQHIIAKNLTLAKERIDNDYNHGRNFTTDANTIVVLSDSGDSFKNEFTPLIKAKKCTTFNKNKKDSKRVPKLADKPNKKQQKRHFRTNVRSLRHILKKRQINHQASTIQPKTDQKEPVYVPFRKVFGEYKGDNIPNNPFKPSSQANELQRTADNVENCPPETHESCPPGLVEYCPPEIYGNYPSKRDRNCTPEVYGIWAPVIDENYHCELDGNCASDISNEVNKTKNKTNGNNVIINSSQKQTNVHPSTSPQIDETPSETYYENISDEPGTSPEPDDDHTFIIDVDIGSPTKPFDAAYQVSDPDRNTPLEIPNYTPASFMQRHISPQSPSDFINQRPAHVSYNSYSAESPRTPSVESSNSFTHFHNSPVSSKVLVHFNTTLYFRGILNIRLIVGNASIFGYELAQNKEVTAHSLTGHCYLNLSPEYNYQSCENLDNLLDKLSELFYRKDLQTVKDNFDSSTDAIAVLEKNDCDNGIAWIEKYMGKCIIPNVDIFENETETRLNCKFLERTVDVIDISPQWQEMEGSLRNRQMIFAAKNAGKSTLLRYLINKKLKISPKILLIDLDIEKSETFLPQTISATVITKPLLGPGFLNNVSPHKSYYFEDITVRSSIILKYLECVLELLNYCNNSPELAELPWIVNTMAYERDVSSDEMRLDVIVGIIRAVNATDLIQITSFKLGLDLSADAINNYSFYVFEVEDCQDECSYTLHKIDAVPHVFQERVQGNNQLERILSRLAKRPSNEHIVCAPLEDLQILVNNNKVGCQLYPSITNGSFCYLCQSMDNELIECYGIGLVKGVDVVTNNVYILPSIANVALEKVKMLAVCCVPVPMSLIVDHSPRATSNIPQANSNFPYIYREGTSTYQRNIRSVKYDGNIHSSKIGPGDNVSE